MAGTGARSDSDTEGNVSVDVRDTSHALSAVRLEHATRTRNFINTAEYSGEIVRMYTLSK